MKVSVVATVAFSICMVMAAPARRHVPVGQTGTNGVATVGTTGTGTNGVVTVGTTGTGSNGVVSVGTTGTGSNGVVTVGTTGTGTGTGTTVTVGGTGTGTGTGSVLGGGAGSVLGGGAGGVLGGGAGGVLGGGSGSAHGSGSGGALGGGAGGLLGGLNILGGGGSGGLLGPATGVASLIFNHGSGLSDFTGILGQLGFIPGLSGAGSVVPGSTNGFYLFRKAIDILSEKACDFALNEATRFADFWVFVPIQSVQELLTGWSELAQGGFDGISTAEIQSVQAQADLAMDTVLFINKGTFQGVQQGEFKTITSYLRCRQLAQTNPDHFVWVSPASPARGH
ncbi:hypothetical protein DRE_06073 [Drechslerella stenobrocha 248]|uniref:Uncharacterized protein n=1 Tax=Drechslerella stenobrocha 248 TaxID=1043628 RepID=W7I854_9PEZI|nr:hypothetical protein DRE_06073 [Drechslerella stenobrocha 248]